MHSLLHCHCISPARAGSQPLPTTHHQSTTDCHALPLSPTHRPRPNATHALTVTPNERTNERRRNESNRMVDEIVRRSLFVVRCSLCWSFVVRCVRRSFCSLFVLIVVVRSSFVIRFVRRSSFVVCFDRFDLCCSFVVRLFVVFVRPMTRWSLSASTRDGSHTFKPGR